MDNSSLLFIFLTGLTTGGLTCLAVQGSLLASLVTKTDNNKYSRITPVFSFLVSKIIFHTFLGFLLGLLGTSIKLSPVHQGYLQVAIGIYLFGVAGNLLNLHPIFRYFVFTPPKFILRFTRNLSKDPNQSSQNITAATLGALTIFLPCATTQAVEVVALASQNPMQAAAILFVFTLGTAPTFLIFGYALTKGQNTFQKNFSKILGYALIFMSLYTVNSGIALTGSIYTAQNFWSAATKQNLNGGTAVLGTTSQIATLNVSDSGYSPQNITLKKGVPVTLNLITDHVENCSRSFTIPSLNIEKLLPETGTSTIEFTPQETGSLTFACSMGMYTGNFNVVN